jgi:inosine-uridine nucleoside N-ribohydrolase
MKSKTILLLASALCMGACNTKTAEQLTANQPEIIILETDMGNDIDDALALNMLYKYMDQGLVDLVGVSVNKPGDAPVEFIDILNTWYGYSDIPIGTVEGGADCENDAVNYAKAVVNMTDSLGRPLFARSKNGYSNLSHGKDFYRKLLTQQPDSSVTLISVGFSTNLSDLLDSEGDEVSPLSGRELVAQKVKLLSVMGGSFAETNPLKEYNIFKDIPAAQNVFANWPTKIVVSPFEVGISILYPATAVENGFDAIDGENPIVRAYESYLPMPYDRPTWDLTSVLCAVEGTDYFSVSPVGNIVVTEEGYTVFSEDPSGKHIYLKTDSVQNAQILNRFVELTHTKSAKDNE